MGERPVDPIEARLLLVARMLEQATAELNRVVTQIKENTLLADLSPPPSPSDERSNDGN